ncbi:MAG: outer rane transport energization protein ExbD [Acidobacteria bacterium]|nr:outer rane transport energization protein ExbD [Acidobacteriota bacterium]
MAKHISAGKVTSDINVTPMADIMLVLLIIFMITTPLLQTGITVNLPKAKNPLEAPEADSQDAVVVALDRNGRIFLGKNQTTESALYEALTKRFGGGEINKTMFLKADQAVLYGRVVEVVNECRKTGVERIGLMTEKEK